MKFIYTIILISALQLPTMAKDGKDGKDDDYHDDPSIQVPETSTVFAGVSIVGLVGAMYLRRKNFNR